MLANLLAKFNQPKSKKDDYQIIQNAKQLLSKHNKILKNIYTNTHTTESHWQKMYLPVLRQLSLFLQALPASENHHHAHLGGFLEHTLEVVDIAIKERNTLMLPRGAGAEVQNDKKDHWTYAVFTAAIMHDIGKLHSDLMVSLYNKNKQPLGRWNAWYGDMLVLGAKYYRYQYNVQRKYQHHSLLATTMLEKIIPITALDYLQQDSLLFSLVLLTISGRYAEGGDIADIIKKADSGSAAKAFVSPQATIEQAHTPKLSLADKLFSAIKYVVLEKQQTKAINEPGAIGFTTEDHIYLISKRLLDEVKAALKDNEQAGVPYDNSRLMDELIDFNIIDKNKANKAIFNITISGGGFKDIINLTTLRMPIYKLYPKENKRPKPFSGKLQEKEAEPETKEPTKIQEEQATQEQETKEEQSKDNTTNEISTTMADLLPPGMNATQPSEATNTNNEDNNSANNETNTTTAQPTQTSDATDIPLDEQLDTMLARECAQLFLKWLTENITQGKIIINNRNAPVHAIKEGLFLVSPSIFKLFSQKHWIKVQHGLDPLKIPKRNTQGKNVHKIIVKKEYHHDPTKKPQTINGFLISNYQEKLNLAKLPINEKVELIST